MILRHLSAALLLCASAAVSAEAPFSFQATPGKLPKSVVPEDYTLSLVPDVAKQAFDGHVSIRLDVREPVQKLVLNALELEISAVSIGDGQGLPVKLTPKLNPQRQTLTLALPRTFAPGRYTLDIAYRGRIQPTTNGLYFGTYKTASGDKLMLGTQMEPADARRMVPCWDEPVFRATFQTSVDLPATWTAYSNTPAEAVETLPSGLKRTRFARTPKMASYLLVLVAGELERLEGRQDGVNLGIVTTEGKRKTGEYALQITRDLLRYYNEYFGVPYPLPKLDQFAVTGTAGFGAMENWGGITYDESILLFDPLTSADSTRRVIYEVVAHEVAHQWFGDLVTMAWWDNLWLNEGFASWMGTKATDRFNPDWHVWQAGQAEVQGAMRLDARKTTHPIQQPVHDEAGALDAFDEITYSKGMAFLRMLETWIGEDAFRAGMREYMKRHQYSSATTADLWNALEQASGKPVRRMAQGWTEQPGFPVIKVAARCENGTRRIELAQERFRVDGKPGPALWVVPVGVSTGGPPAFELLDARTRTLERPGCDALLVVDPDAVGYYRVEYAPELLAAIGAQWGQLPLDARIKLLNDTWALAGVGRLALAHYLDLLSQARNDPEPTIWHEIVERLRELDQLAVGEPARASLQAFGVALLRPQLAALGWESRRGDSQEVLELRPRVIEALGRFGDEAVRAEALARFQRFLKEPDSLPAALANPVATIAGRYADAATHAALLAKVREAKTSEEQRRFLRGFVATVDPALARATLEASLGDTLPAPLAVRIPVGIAIEHPQLAWSFARANYQALQGRLSSMQANDYFGAVVERTTDARYADELMAWGTKHLPVAAKASLERSADAIRFNAKLKARVLPQLSEALAKPQRRAASE